VVTGHSSAVHIQVGDLPAIAGSPCYPMELIRAITRPAEMLDRMIGEHVDLLFAMRARQVANTYIYAKIIPSLCRKALVPGGGVRPGRRRSGRRRT
jgi:hypothetical protein